MELSIVIPAYNEEKRLQKTLDVIVEFCKKKRIKYEIIVVNDGSTDKTKHIIQANCRINTRIMLVDNNKNRGKGYSVKHGVKKASGDLILFSDSDLSTPIEEYEKLKEYIDKGYDIAIGSRRIKGSEIKIKQPLHRRLIGKIFGLLVEILLLKGIKDTQCGFKLFRTNTAKNVFTQQRIRGYCFDVEILYISRNEYNAKIKEVPVTWINSAELSKVNVVKESPRMLKDLIKIRYMR